MLELEIEVIDGFGYLVVAVIINYLDKQFADSANCGDIRPVRVINILRLTIASPKSLTGSATHEEVKSAIRSFKPLSGDDSLYMLVV